MSHDLKKLEEEVIADPDPDYEYFGMRPCTECGKWFPTAQWNHIYCKDCAEVIWKGGDRHATIRKGDRHKNRNALTRPFIGIDGEGGGTNEHGQQNYLLLCASGTDGTASVLCKNNERLTTIDCLEFILSLPSSTDAILVGFFFEYDITMILWDLPEERLRRLVKDREEFNADGRRISPYTWWRDYAIEYVPKQYLRVARLGRKPINDTRFPISGTARTINEVGGFFQKPFVKVIAEWKVATEDEIAEIGRMKDSRPDFDQITPVIQRYCETEGRLLAETMTRFRERCIAGTEQVQAALPDTAISLVPRNWRGAGHLAARMHESAGTPKSKGLPGRPPELENTAKEAYYGGRFEISRTGHIAEPVFEYDINSAYPSAMSLLPCPMHTQWHKVEQPSPGSLYIADLSFEHPKDNIWCGFPFRTKDGHIHFPINGSGVYWSIEIEAAKCLGAKVKFHAVWQATKCCDCEPYKWVPALYEYRKQLGKGTEGYPIKLGLNALYGKLLQREGARAWHDDIAAGLITAITRAKLISAVALDPRAVAMLATDGVYSTRPLPLAIGTALGTWEAKEHPDMFIVQPGLYWFPRATQADATHKTRGIPKAVVQKYAQRFESAWRHFLTTQPQHSEPNAAPFVRIPLGQFIGMRLALQRRDLTLAGRWLQPCTGQGCTHENCGSREVSFDWSGKRSRGLLVGQTVNHLPIIGDVSDRSTPYDPNLLTEIEQRDRDFEAMPDYVEFIEK
jgi:hypothetical protein